MNQSLDFERHIQLIIVNDGSTDGSTDIIKSWQQRYPHNILYLEKQNGGQGSARNLGLNFAGGDWVTFIDPDDFVDREYFTKVEKFAVKRAHENLALLSCNLIIYHEDRGSYKNAHPLKYRFKKGSRVIPAKNPGDFIQLSVNSAFFSLQLLQASELKMDERIRPSFEDAHFVTRYLLAHRDYVIGIVPKAKYYYRKRKDESSALDKGSTEPGYYDQVLELGCLSLLNEAKDNHGKIPRWVQRVVLYHLAWKIKTIVNNPASVQFLPEEKRQRFFYLLCEIFELIDEQIIKKFELARYTDVYKIGTLGLFKQQNNIYSDIRVVRCDQKRRMIKLSYCYYGQRPAEEFCIGDKKATPAFAKDIGCDFLNHKFSTERIVWLPYAESSLTEQVGVKINQAAAGLSVEQHKAKDSLALKKIIARLEPSVTGSGIPLQDRIIRRLARTKAISRCYQNAWLFMDRDTQADDNAEHLYRYVKKHHPDIKALFILRQSSHDWHRLKKAGFKMIKFDSVKHKLALLNARHLISSHFDQYATSFLDKKYYRDRIKYDFTFLRHGVSIGDMSGPLNKKPIDLFITSSPREYRSIVEPGSPYHFCEKEVVLTGLPRHDALLENNHAKSKMVLIMPTWRKWLTGKAVGKGNERQVNPKLYQSEFAQYWKLLLHSAELMEITKRHGYQVALFPHVNLAPYMKWFSPPDYIETRGHSHQDSIQVLFKRASCMITDYSSAAFEMAYLEKPVLYYQFDQNDMFAGSHIAKKGYFDYNRDGFGPTCQDLPSLLKALDSLLESHCRPDPKYLARMNSTFAFRDGSCCERVVDAIFSLEQSEQ